MRINKINHISPSVTTKKFQRKTGVQGPKRNTDRIEIDNGSSVSRMELAIKENIIKFQTKKLSVEKLDFIKQRIEQGSYRVDTGDIIKAMLL